MHQQDIYLAEKLREMEAMRRPAARPAEFLPVRGGRPLAPFVRGAGRRIRGFGEALERWASPPVPRDAAP